MKFAPQRQSSKEKIPKDQSYQKIFNKQQQQQKTNLSQMIQNLSKSSRNQSLSPPKPYFFKTSSLHSSQIFQKNGTNSANNSLQKSNSNNIQTQKLNSSFTYQPKINTTMNSQNDELKNIPQSDIANLNNSNIEGNHKNINNSSTASAKRSASSQERINQSQQSPSKNKLNQMISSSTINNSPQSRPKTSFSKFGLSLEPYCNRLNHEKSKITYFCVDANCKEIRYGCAHCILQLHGDHSASKITINHLFNQCEDNYSKYLNNVQNFQSAVENITNPFFYKNIQKHFNDIKADFCNRIDKISNQFIEMYNKETLNDQLLINNEWQKNKLFGKTMQQQMKINLLEMDIKQQEFLRNQYDDIFNCDLLKQIDNLQNRQQRLEDIFTQSFKQFQTNFLIEMNQLFSSYPEIQLIQLGTSPQHKLQYLIEQKKALEKHLEDQSVLIKQLIEINTEISKIKIHQKSQEFPYIIYNQSCQHSIQCNTIPIFECCKQAFQCPTCHDKQQNHRCYLTNPSKRYCMKCFHIFTVNYSTNIPINCQECI